MMPRQDFSDVRISKKQRAIEKRRAEERKAEAEKLHKAAEAETKKERNA